MTSEQRDQLVQAIEAALKEASGTTAENVYEFFAKAEPWVRNAASLVGEVKSREALIAFLERIPAEYDIHIPLALGVIASLPELAVQAGKETLKPAAKAVLTEKLGRRQAVPEEIKPKIVHYIGELHTRGTKKGVAQRRACQQFGLKLRSVQEVWRRRENYKEAQQPSSLAEIFELLGVGTREHQ